MRVSVVIVTIDRPECVRRCLECVLAQDPAPAQVIVVDASAADDTRRLCAALPGVTYLRNERGLGHTTHSRNLALRHATGEVIAFLDDDAYARPGWLTTLAAAYDDPSVGAVGGRALNAQPGEESQGLELVGRLTPDGVIHGYFAADTGRVIDVDHVIGCNMSIRRDVIDACGGFREGFNGRYCFREESDIFLVMKRLGYRVRFTPFAVVDHVAGPKPKGRRFDLTYAYYAERNHYILLVRNFGLFHPIVWRYFVTAGRGATVDLVRRVGGAILRCGAVACGTATGLWQGHVWRRRQQGWETGRDPGQANYIRTRPDLATGDAADATGTAAVARARDCRDAPTGSETGNGPSPVQQAGPVGVGPVAAHTGSCEDA